jgi:hypothetical protein
METDSEAKGEKRRTAPNRRIVLRHAGTGLLLATGLSGVATARGRESGNADTAGRPTVVVSTPSCETLQVDYVRGNPPVSVVATGPETVTARLDDATRSVDWAVAPGEYEVTAAPGGGAGKGTPAVVVEGSPVTVAPCPTADPGEVESTGLSVSATCLASDEGLVSYTVTNPTDEDATVTVAVSADLSFEVQRDVAAGSSVPVPEDGGLTADGTWTHEFTATGAGGGSLTVNDQDVWTNVPDCA